MIGVAGKLFLNPLAPSPQSLAPLALPFFSILPIIPPICQWGLSRIRAGPRIVLRQRGEQRSKHWGGIMKTLLALVGAALAASSIGCCANRCGNSCGCGTNCNVATSQHAPRMGQMQGQACPCDQGLLDAGGNGGHCGHRGGLLGAGGYAGGEQGLVNSAVGHALDCARPTTTTTSNRARPPAKWRIRTTPPAARAISSPASRTTSARIRNR